MPHKPYRPKKSDILLGFKIKSLRKKLNLSQMDLGREVNNTSQQIDRYESGMFIPLAKLEEIGSAFNIPIAKKIIRRISIERKLQDETGTPRDDELIALYSEAFPEELEDA